MDEKYFRSVIQKNFAEHILLQQNSVKNLADLMIKAAQLLINTLKNNHTIFTCGNGGSACDALHFSGELLGRFEKERDSLPAINLNSDIAALTCISNDYNYCETFTRPLQALSRPGDLLLVFTTSGNSENICRAIKVACLKQLSIIALTGKTGGQLAELLKSNNYTHSENIVEIRVPSMSTPRIQETHGLILHNLCELIDQALIN